MKPAARILAAALPLLWAGAAAFAAGTKTSGTTTVTDDLTGASAGSVGLVSGASRADGALGQTAAGFASSGSVELQSGFFAPAATMPASLSFQPVGQSSLTVAWADASPANPAGTLYTLEASTAADFSGILRSSQTLGLSAAVTGLSAGTTYYARVRAAYAQGEESTAATVSTTTLPDSVPPAAPAAVAAYQSGASNTLTVQWVTPGDDGASGDLPAGSEFRLQWSSLNPVGVDWSTANAQVVIATGPVAAGLLVSADVGSLPSLSTVSFRVWAADDAGNWSAASGTAPASVSPFAFETVAAGGSDSGEAASLAVDRAGDLHVLYRDATAPALKHLKRTAGVWGAPQTVYSGLYSNLSLAVDPDGRLHAAFKSDAGPALAYARYDGAWSSSTIESSVDAVPSLAIDSRGKVMVAYGVFALGDLKFAEGDGSAWTLATVDSLGQASNSVLPSLVLDALGLPNVAYALPTGGSSAFNLKFASRGALGAWSVSELQPISVNSADPGLAIDGNGELRVTYYAYSTGDYRYMRRTDSGWSPPQAIDRAQNRQNSMTLDGAGGVHLAYTSGSPQDDLKHAYSPDGVTWTTHTVDSRGNVGWPVNPVAVDGTGAVRIVYRDATNAALKAAHWTGSPFAPAIGGRPGSLAQGPHGLTGRALGPSSATWSWSDAATNELGYRLYLSSPGSPNGSFYLALSTGASPGDAGASTRFVDVTGLTPNTSYQAYVVAVASGGVAASSAALAVNMPIETPTGIYFDEISSRSITASAYAPGAAFSSMTAGLSGVNVARDGAFAGWRGESWTALGPMLAARRFLAAAGLGGRVYAVGGEGPLTANEEYDPAANAWAARAALPTARGQLGVAAAGGRLYAVGGEPGPVAANEEYDPAANAWTARKAMPTARFALAVAEADGKVYAVGGFNGVNLTTNEEYDPSSDAWRTRAPALSARNAMGAASVGGLIYVMGGAAGSNLATHERYDPGADAWATRASLSTPTVYLAAAALGGKVYAVGGSNGASLNVVVQYDPAADAWASRSDMPTARERLAAAAAGGRIYAVGGFNAVSLAANERFDPGVASSFTALTPNTQYSFKAKARNRFGEETAESPTVSTYTLAAATSPQAGMPLFSQVFASSVTVNWSSGTDAGGYNGPGATYLVQASTMATFIPVAGSSLTGNVFAAVPNLLANATHYFRVRAYNALGGTDHSWFILGSTVTAIEAPTEVYFDEVTTHSITASAYAPTPAFSSMTAGLSGTNVAKDGVYAGWHGERWTIRAAMLSAREHVAGAALDGLVYALGGNLGGATRSPAVDAYNPATDAWTARATLSPARWSIGAAGPAGRLHAFGGDDGAASSAADSYDPGSNQWSAEAALPVARSPAGAVRLGGGLYSLGPDARMDRRDLPSGAWVRLADAPGNIAQAAAVSRGRILAAESGGSATYSFDPGAGSWSTLAGMLTARTGMRAASVGGKAYFIGGLAGSYSDLNEEFDPAVNAWTARARMSTAHNNPGVAALRGRIHVFGGGQSSPLSVHEEYDPGVAQHFAGLQPNKQYSFKAKARNSVGVETGETVAVSTYTLAVATVPQAGTPLFSAVFASSLTVNWSSGTDAGGYNGPGATYLAQASTMATFVPVAGSSLTGNVFAAVPNLFANATHYFRVRAYNALGGTDFGWVVLGSTVTAIEAPTDVYFDEITTHSITASAYAPATAFSSMTTGLSGANVARDGLYAGWHGEKWTVRAAMPAARQGQASGVIGGRMFVVGGWNGAHLAANEEFDPALNVWTPKAAMPTARANLVAGVVGGRLYAVGGDNPAALGANEEYDPIANAWTARNGMPTPRTKPAAGVLGGRLYVVGGTDGSDLSVNEAYDPASDSWSGRAALLTARHGAAAAVVGGKLYAMGGDAGGPLATNEEYDPGANSWVAKSGMPTARFSLAGAAIGGRAYAVGGNGGGASAANESYDPVADTWRVERPMPTARFRFTAAAAGGRLYAVGGENGISDLAVNEEYDPGVAQHFAGLQPNKQYSFKAKARNRLGIETAESPSISTYTLAAATVPQGGAPVFSEVFESSLTVNWSSGTDAGGYNGPGATYLVQASTMASFVPVAGSSLTGNVFGTIPNLLANATNYLRVRAYNAVGGTDYRWLVLGSTVTQAVVPASAASTYSAVSDSSLFVSWDSNGNGSGTRYELVRSTDPFPNADPGNLTVSSEPAGAPGASVPASANTTYYFQVRALSRGGTPTAYAGLGSTITSAAVPAPSTQPFAGVFLTSMTVRWSSGTNPGWTQYRVDAATSADFAGQLWSTGWEAFTSTTVSGLARNTTYWVRAQARNAAGTPTGFLALGATATLAGAPVDGGNPFPSVFVSSLAASWSAGGNPPGTRYEAVVSTLASAPDASADEVRVATTDPSAVLLSGLVPNSTHYLFARAVNWNGVASEWSALGATVTRVEAPTGLYFDEITSNTIVASAYAPTPAFSNLHLGTAGTNVAIGGAYAGWHGSTWTVKAPDLTTRSYHSGAALNGRIHVVGGYAPGDTAVHAAYDPASNSWSSRAALTSARKVPAVAAVGGGLVSAGGLAGFGAATTLTEAYDPQGNAWSARAAMPTPRYNAAVAVLEGRMHVVGGQSGWAGAALAAHEVFDPEAGVWSTRAPLPVPHGVPRAAVTGDRLIVIEGASVYEYHVAGDSWTTRAASPFGQSFGAAAAVGGKVYYLGGDSPAPNRQQTSEFDPAADRWAARPLMPTADVALVAAAVRGRVYAIGGENPNGSYHSTNREYDPGVTAVFTSLAPNTQYAFKAKARNQAGTETPESVDVTTYTLAAVPSTATPTFTAVWVSSVSVQWTANNNPSPTEYRAQASTADFSGSGDILTSWQAVTSTAVASLAANATYFVRVQARNFHGLATDWKVLGSTVTGAAKPAPPAGSSFTAVAQSSVTLAWGLGTNPADTEFRVRASTAADFSGTDVLSPWLIGQSTAVAGLSPDTTYYWLVTARNRSGIQSEPRDFGAQATLANEPALSTEPYHSVGVSSVTVQWQANGNPASTAYEAQASTAPDFAAVIASGWVQSLSTTVAGLAGDSTYYWRVRARGSAGQATPFLSLGSTATLAADPVSPVLRSVGPASLRVGWGTGGNREGDSLSGWTALSALPSPRERHAAVLVSGRIYVSGGLVSGAPSAEVWSAPAGGGAWVREADLPAPRESHAMAASAGRLYVVGGFDGTAKDTVYWAPVGPDGRVGSWSASSPLPAARFKLALAAHEGWLYALGGDNGVFAQSSVFVAPIRDDGRVGGWSTATSLPAARNSHAAAVSSGTVYVAGGLGAGVEEEVWSATLAGASVGPWTALAPLPVPVFGHALAATGGRLVVAGGHDGNAATAQVLAGPPWETLTPLPAARLAQAAVLSGPDLHVLGGSDGASASADVYRARISGTEYLVERAQDGGYTVDYGSSDWKAGAGTELSGLTPNRTYSVRVRSRMRSGAQGAPVSAGSTVTLAAVPGSAASTFTLVEAGSVTVNWTANGNPAGTEFLAAVSTAPDFTGAADSGWTTAFSTAVWGLVPNTTYYGAAQARNAAGVRSPPVLLGSTMTLASVPESLTVSAVQTFGFTLSWSTAGNPALTRYEAQLATAPAFSAVQSSVTLSSSVVYAGLLSATTYYVRVRAFNGLGAPSAYSAAASTVTGQDLSPPGAVGGLGVHPTASPGTLLAAWTAPGDDGPSGGLPAGSRFYLQWSVSDPSGVAWSTANAQLSVSTGPLEVGAAAGLAFSGPSVGSFVSVRLWAVDESDNVSEPSAVATAWVSPFSLSRLGPASGGASVALDRAGDAHAAYTAGGELRYLKRTGGVWGVAEAPDPGVPAAEPVIAVDGAGVPQIVFHNPQTGQLRHARRAGGWAASAVAAGDLRAGGLGLDATGHAHVSYYDAAAGDLRYARWDGTAWQVETVDSAGDVGRRSSLALDGGGRPRVAYYDVTNADLKFASRSAGGLWSLSVADSGAVNVGSSPVIALDGAGDAVIAHVDPGARDLRVTRYDGAAWSTQLVDSAADVTAAGGLALDGAGKGSVSYYDGTLGDLRLARFDGTSWSTGTIASLGDAGADSDLAVGPDGSLLVMHHDAGAGDLVAGSWSAGLAAPMGGGPRGRVSAPAAFAGVVASSTSVQWVWTDSAEGELGWRVYGSLSSTGPFTLIAGTGTIPATAGSGTQRVYTETGLAKGTTYFRYAAAVSSGGAVVSPMAAAAPQDTSDVTPPAIVDNQPGDGAWRRAAGALYDVDFTDTGGSGLDTFYVKASTTAGDSLSAGTFTAVVAGILVDVYTQDWALPAGVFAGLADGATSYVTVRVVDGNGNAAALVDAFTVLKDTSPPVIVDGQPGDPARRSSSGTLYDVDAFDSASGLERFQYSVSTSQLTGDGSVIGWTDIPLMTGATAFTANWGLDFGLLLGDATNFVSVRAWDRAGSTATMVDAFFVVKDTAGPSVAVSSPSAAFHSALGTLRGTAADAAGLGAAQVAVQESPPAGLWFDGAGFTSGSQVWLAASGTASWTFSAVPAWAEGSAYRVVARASDTLGNFSVAYATSDFTFDSAPPQTAVTTPLDGAALSVLPALSGTAADAVSGLALIEVRLRRVSDGSTWSWASSTWTAAAVATTPAAGSPWSVPVPEALRASLAHGASYFVSARAVDNALPSNAGAFAGSTFTWTDTAPPAAITGLSALTGPKPREIALSWTAPGDDGTSGMIQLGEYRVHFSTEAGAAFSTAAAQVAFSTSGVVPGTREGRVISGLESGATYFLRVFLADDAGNWSPLSDGATAYAGVQPFNKIAGHVTKSSSEGVTAVLVEAYDSGGGLLSSAFSLSDGSGTYLVENLVDGVYRVQATWTAGDITSSVWIDGVAMGTSGVDFMLEINYTLSTLTGTLASLSAQAASPAGFLARAAEDGYREALVELLRGGAAVASARPDPTGRWTIANLLPGKYSVRATNGLETTEAQEVQLGEGETQEVVFVFDPLPEASVFAFPNPARSGTTFRFVSGLPGLEAQVAVFDIAGVLVRELPGSAMAAKGGGLYHAAWDLSNDQGEAVASGVYLFMVKVKGSNGQNGKVVKKLAVVR